ncbi:MAG: OmpH family outer membrane protein [Alistipes sp.]|nr:OmpH family outer membrane protein [Alistipes sp.]MBQ3208773.1 OmpH family outer membrane protein [Alistipes sp.]MBQ6869653.1 OmpH family outer membrane protein [Alistipes sp.]MBQ7951501.1 OmpH family outer membrane protein [Alistipes sp.]MBQ9963443.1 OmpH family outer membrane protein [Alistipes sp.]
MKKVLFAAVALVFAVSCNTAPKTTETEAAQTKAEAVATDLAFVRTDAVFAESEIFKTEGVALQSKNEKTQKTLAEKEQKLQNEMVQLQEKYQKGLITTIEAQRKEQDIQKRVAAYQESAQKQLRALEEENLVFQNRMGDLMQRAIDEINADGAYKMIVNASALLDASEELDITSIVLDKVNELYAADKASK